MTTSVDQHIADYEREEARAAREEEMMSESTDFAVNGESARFIPAHDVLDADVPTFRRYGNDDFGRVFVKGVNGEE